MPAIYSSWRWLLLALLPLAGRAQRAPRPAMPQVVVPTSPGSLGSYASNPPTPTMGNNNALDTARYDFYYRSPLYVSRAARQQHRPLPTNDWWTDLLVRGKDAGLLWVYPLVVDPDPNGFNLNFPTTLDVAGDGNGFNAHYGGNVRFGGAGYVPSTAVAESWSDWGLVLNVPDTLSGKGLRVTMAHGVPFTWVETSGGLNPILNTEQPATCLDGSGQALAFPHQGSFVISTDGRTFGVHLPAGATLAQDTLKYAQVDLGQVRTLAEVKLTWEAAYARSYDVQVSDDGQTWQTVRVVTGKPDKSPDDFTFAGGVSGRYLRLLLRKRATQYGYSLYEIQAYDGSGALVSQGRPVSVSSTENGGLLGKYLTDGDLTTRWSSSANQPPVLVLQLGAANSYFVVSALNAATDLGAYEQYAFNKVSDTQVQYAYDPQAGKVSLNWRLTTTNLQDGSTGGPTLQGFLPHLTQNAASSLSYTPYTYLTPRGQLPTAAGTSFGFTYDFLGIIPAYNAPYRDAADAHPYDAQKLFDLVSAYAADPSNGNDTYFGGKDLVQHMKFALLARQLNHQAYPALKEKARQSIVDWLTYTPGEGQYRYFARLGRWGAMVGFNPSFGSDEFTDNHFHYGYFTLACALYGMMDPDFLKPENYGGMARQVAKQYANWDRTDGNFPWFRTFDPWVGHSYAGGTSSGNGNNQESSSESMQSWMGLFLLGDALGDADMRAAGAFGYSSEAAACLEYWFDWKGRNFPQGYQHRMGAILSNQGLGHATYFGGQEEYVHGIEYLPVNPGLTYLARDPSWALREYNDLLAEAKAKDKQNDELDFGADWTHVALGFRYLFDPQYVTGLLEANYQLPTSSPRYIMGDKEVAGITYSYAHSQQNLGLPSTRYHTNLPSSTVFEKNGQFSRAVAYNPTSADVAATVLDQQGNAVTDAQGNVVTQVIPARTLVTFPTPPTTGIAPSGCYNLVPAAVSASSGNATPGADGDQGTRWESAFADPQQFTVDYGTPAALSTITITWENASAKNYQLLGSLDNQTWAVLVDNSQANFPASPAGQGRTDSYPVSGTYRYVRMAGLQRTTQYGYSFYELTTCGAAASASSPGPLPVQLTDFAARYEAAAVQLSWHTASELHSDHFEVERSLNGVSFSRLGSVAAVGTSATTRAYAYRDAALPAGATRLYYRLRQVDADGTATYSPTRVVELPLAAGLTLFPNPAHHSATLQGTAPGSPVQLLDAVGRVVLATTADTGGTAQLLLPAGLPGGVYVVRAGQQALRLTVQ